MEIESVRKFRTPGTKPEGIGWDGEAFWIIDSKNNMIQRISEEKGDIIKSFEIEMEKPRSVTWDGKNLWFIENKNNTINMIDLEKEEIDRSFEAPLPFGKGKKSLEGLVWSGKSLWSASYAGWSSKIYKLDPIEGDVLLSFFSECWPRGMATDGEVIWTLCYNGKKFPPMIDRRKISEKPVDLVKSREIMYKLPKIKDPGDLTFDGKRLLILDRISNTIHSVEVK